MAIKTEVQVQIKSSSPFEATAKMEAIKKFAELDFETMDMLSQLATPKGIAKLKSNFKMIKKFIV